MFKKKVATIVKTETRECRHCSDVCLQVTLSVYDNGKIVSDCPLKKKVHHCALEDVGEESSPHSSSGCVGLLIA